MLRALTAMKSVSVCLLLACLSTVAHSLVEDALVTEKVYLDLEVEGAAPERLVIGLFGATSPKTVRNFVSLANHEVRSSLVLK